MPTLDLKQITDKLNAEFAGETRKIVFWYDDAAEFIDNIDTLDIVGAKLHKLEPDTMFQTKYLLERYDTESSYLIYAPFPKPDARNNALEDTLIYSRRFYADRASLLSADLRIDEKYKPIIQKYIKFFGEKSRTQWFYDFEIENFNDETIEIALMSALCKSRTASIDEVLRAVLLESYQLSATSYQNKNPSENCQLKTEDYLSIFDKYDLLPAFWRLCEDAFGYNADSPSIKRLTLTLFITYTARQFSGNLPQAWKEFVSYKSGSIIAFLVSLMNSIPYRPQYDKLAESVASTLNLRETLSNTSPEYILDCDAFAVFDELILHWITERLLDEDIGAALNGMDITKICDMRRRKHFGAHFAVYYEMLEAAHGIISVAQYDCRDTGIKELVDRYIRVDCRVDNDYRHFYTAFDRVADDTEYEKLREKVESIYTNEFLGKLLPVWNTAFDTKALMQSEQHQTRFFNSYIKCAKDKTVVIISDALRYEVALELFSKLEDDPNCSATMKYSLAILPAYTQLGMAALLPHKTIEIVEAGKVLVDDRPSDSTEKREGILRSAIADSRCIRADSIPTKRDEFRKIFTGMDIVYVYHDHIDIRGSSSENEVFNACSEAIEEIYNIIKRLSGSGNVYNFIVTADHGFLYKRDPFTESDKIDSFRFSVLSSQNKKDTFRSRRCIIAPSLTTENYQLITSPDGVASAKLSDIIGGEDERMVYWPIGANVFKTQGSLNYVHGGFSPQEIVLPVITIKMERSHVDTQPVRIALVSMVQKITNLITQLDFIQQEPVSDVVTSAEYKLYFISEENEKISNEHIYMADKKDSDPNKRMFRQRFNFKNKKYSASTKYWLVAVNIKSGVELFRHQVIMDIAFADDFGFDV